MSPAQVKEVKARRRKVAQAAGFQLPKAEEVRLALFFLDEALATQEGIVKVAKIAKAICPKIAASALDD